MKTEGVLLLLIAGVILYKYSQQSSGTIPTHTIDCSQPGADPVMCAWIAEHQAQTMTDLLEVMVP